MKEQLISPLKGPEAKLVCVLTLGCPQRCTYCIIPKGLVVMSPQDLEAGIDYVMGSWRPNVQIHFFGGEPLMMPLKRYRTAIAYARRRAEERGKKVKFVISTGAVLLDDAFIDFFKENDFNVEVSLDGAPETQNLNRPVVGGNDAYAMAVKRLPRLFASGVDAHCSMVVDAGGGAKFYDNLRHIVDLGFRKVFVMTACGVDWTPQALDDFQRNLDQAYPYILGLIKEGNFVFHNLKDWLAPFRINTELAIAVEGQLTYTSVACLVHDKDVRHEFVLGRPSQKIGASFDEIYDSRLTNEEIIPLFYKYAINTPKWLLNNIDCGMRMTRLVQALKKDLGVRDEFSERNEVYLKACADLGRRAAV